MENWQIVLFLIGGILGAALRHLVGFHSKCRETERNVLGISYPNGVDNPTREHELEVEVHGEASRGDPS